MYLIDEALQVAVAREGAEQWRVSVESQFLLMAFGRAWMVWLERVFAPFWCAKDLRKNEKRAHQICTIKLEIVWTLSNDLVDTVQPLDEDWTALVYVLGDCDRRGE